MHAPVITEVLSQIASAVIGAALIYRSRLVARRTRLMHDTPTTDICDVAQQLEQSGSSSVFVELKGQVCSTSTIAVQAEDSEAPGSPLSPRSPRTPRSPGPLSAVIVRTCVTRRFETPAFTLLAPNAFETKIDKGDFGAVGLHLRCCSDSGYQRAHRAVQNRCAGC